MIRVLSVLLVSLALALSGCAGSDDEPEGTPTPTGTDGPGPEDPGDSGDRAVQTYTGGFDVVTPYGCAEFGSTAVDGTMQDSAAVDADTVGGPFKAYINVTTGVDLVVSVVFVDNASELTGNSISGSSGARLSGDVPAGSTRVIFSGCGIGAGASVWYQAVQPAGV